MYEELWLICQRGTGWGPNRCILDTAIAGIRVKLRPIERDWPRTEWIVRVSNWDAEVSHSASRQCVEFRASASEGHVVRQELPPNGQPSPTADVRSKYLSDCARTALLTFAWVRLAGPRDHIADLVGDQSSS